MNDVISTGTTDGNGSYTLTGVPPGQYKVIPQSTDDTIFIKTSIVDVTDGDVTNINFNAITSTDPNFDEYMQLVSKNQIKDNNSLSDWLTDIF